MKIKYIILTCEKYHDTRVSSIRNTWGDNQDITFLSDLNIGKDIIGYKHLNKGYENIWGKYYEFLKNLYSYDNEWYFFTDDDTFVNINNIENLLCNYNFNDPICIGHLGALHQNGNDNDGNHTGFPIHTINGKDTHLPIYYVSGGAGFILSKKSIEFVCEYLRSLDFEKVPRSYNGDVTFGFWLRNSGVEIIDTHGFWWTNPRELNHNIDDIIKSYTYHYIDYQEMILLYNNVLNYENNSSESSINEKSNEINFTIITQIRNEEKRLIDWINYHKKIGIDEFIIYLDNCTDKSKSILEELSKTINIKIREANTFGTYPDSDNPNTYSSYSVVMRIKDSLKRGLKEVRESNKSDNHWTIFTEVDEYIVPQTELSFFDVVKNVSKNRIYIASYDYKCPFDLDYPVYNQTYLRWSDSVRENGVVKGILGYFKNRGKSLVRTNFVLSDDVDIHDVDYSDYFQDNELLKINHYRNNGELQIYDFEDKKILNWL